MSKLRPLFALLSVLLMLSSTRPAAAHGFIVRAVPPDRAVLDRAPTRVQYWFSEGLEIAFSSINVRDSNGTIIASAVPAPENPTQLTVALPAALPDGAYIVELRPAFASDGHVYAETRVFFIGAESATAASSDGGGALPVEVAWRTVSYAAVLLAFGACLLYAAVLIPAWGSATQRAGRLPPRLMQRLTVLVGVSIGVALIGSVVALLQQTTAFFGVGLGEVLSRQLWSVV
ncbi:MAG: copper resistance protein CopC, partial [Armatimonadetes bacterium]|nr:copper resistance protein CopC [Anaerolineae bacterium]